MPAQNGDHAPGPTASALAAASSRLGIHGGRMLVFLFFVLSAGIPRAYGQEAQTEKLAKMSLEDLMSIQVDTVYGASKFEQKVTEAPSSITIITADEIQKYGYRTLAEVLGSVPGFYVTTDRNYTYLGMDGISRPTDFNAHLLVLIDGHRMNNAIFDGAYIGTEGMLDVDLIQRVEIIRGPGSSLYGTNAFLGVINVVTKRGRDLQGVEVSADGGSLQSYRGRASYGRQYSNGTELLVSATGYDSQGHAQLFFPEFNAPATNNGIAQNVDGDRFGSAFLSATYGDWALRSGLVSRGKHIPTGSWGTVFNDPRTETTDTSAFADVQYGHVFSGDWQVEARGFYDWYKYDALFVYDLSGMGVPPFTVNDDYERGNWAGFDTSVSKHIGERHYLKLGTEETFNINLVMGNYDQQPFVSYLYDRHSSTQAAVYGEDQFRIRKDLLLSAGLRYDHYSTFGGTINPRVGLIYSPQEGTDLKLLYGRAFRAPDDYELNYSQLTSGFEPNPGLRPERIQTTQIVVEKYLKHHAAVSAAGFYSKMDDLISQSSDPVLGTLYFANLEQVRNRGVEFQFSEKRPSGWEGRVSYTVQRAQSSITGADFSNSPRHVAKVNVIAPLVQKRLFLGLEGQEVSRRSTVNDTLLGGFFVANATLFSRELLSGLQLSGSIYNVFNKRYQDAVGQELRQNGILQDGRAFRVKISYRFNP